MHVTTISLKVTLLQMTIPMGIAASTIAKKVERVRAASSMVLSLLRNMKRKAAKVYCNLCNVFFNRT